MSAPRWPDRRTEPGKVTVTIRCERDDGQFTIVETLVPGDLVGTKRERQYDVENKIARGFVDAYARLMRLPS